MSRPHLLWLAFLLLVAAILFGIHAMKSNGAADNPLYVDASHDKPCTPVNPCLYMRCKVKPQTERIA